MEIKKVISDKKEFLELLLLADEQESMVDRYLERGDMFVLNDYGLLVGTGDVSSTISFYEHCGFTISHRVENFFTDNYDHPIYEEGKLLTDMVYLKRTF